MYISTILIASNHRNPQKLPSRRQASLATRPDRPPAPSGSKPTRAREPMRERKSARPADSDAARTAQPTCIGHRSASCGPRKMPHGRWAAGRGQPATRKGRQAGDGLLFIREYRHTSFSLHSPHLGLTPHILYLSSAENDQMNVSTIPGEIPKSISSTE